jgi:hypothetical protein
MNLSGMFLTFITSDGPGGIVVISVVVLAAAIYFFLIRYIMAGGEPARAKK